MFLPGLIFTLLGVAQFYITATRPHGIDNYFVGKIIASVLVMLFGLFLLLQATYTALLEFLKTLQSLTPPQ